VGGITYQAIQQLEAGGGTKHLVLIAAPGRQRRMAAGRRRRGPPARRGRRRAAIRRRLKVLGMANAVRRLVAVERRCDRHDRPPANLAGVPGAYAVYAWVQHGTRYHPGELMHIHPASP